MNTSSEKQYGLIVPKSKQNALKNTPAPNVTKKPSVFGEDSSSNSDDDSSTDWLKKKLKASANTVSATSAGHSGGMKKQNKVITRFFSK